MNFRISISIRCQNENNRKTDARETPIDSSFAQVCVWIIKLFAEKLLGLYFAGLGRAVLSFGGFRFMQDVLKIRFFRPISNRETVL